jgi:ABC-type Fe3+/spermidine/putrescine transport system ATPase subunit
LLRVSTGSEILACVLHGNACPSIGARVLLVLRPEKISVVPANRACAEGHGEEETNSVRATVMVNTYCGDHREISAVAKDFSLRIVAPNTAAADVGAEVRLEFAAGDLHLLQG